jgi:hypothetical protein
MEWMIKRMGQMSKVILSIVLMSNSPGEEEERRSGWNHEEMLLDCDEAGC